MVGSLGKALGQLGHEVTLVSPFYRGIEDRYRDLEPLASGLSIQLGNKQVRAALWERRISGNERVIFVDCPAYFDRPELYTESGTDYPDNAERFIFFSKAVVGLVLGAEPAFDIVHVHDWQTALVPLMLRHENDRATQGNGTPTCITLHNLAYQGVFPRDQFAHTGLPPDWFNPDTSEFYGQFSALKSGITAADVITTVSPRYAREITTAEFGCGLDGLLRHRQDALHGILNGVDYDEWTTSTNLHLQASYTAESMEGKTANKLALQKELSLNIAPDQPLFGSVTRLVDQKGVDLTLGALEALLDDRMQFVMVGSGSPEYERFFKELAARHPGKVAIRIGYDTGLSHRVEAASDFFLMPSRFEPCGLNQLYSLRYGTVPIVRAVGGLDDSVVDINESEALANGIKFYEATVAALAHSIRKALALYEVPALMTHYQRNGMAAEFSCMGSAKDYADLYNQLVSSRS